MYEYNYDSRDIKISWIGHIYSWKYNELLIAYSIIKV